MPNGLILRDWRGFICGWFIGSKGLRGVGLCRGLRRSFVFLRGSRPLRGRAIIMPCLAALVCSGRAIWAEWLNFVEPASRECCVRTPDASQHCRAGSRLRKPRPLRKGAQRTRRMLIAAERLGRVRVRRRFGASRRLSERGLALSAGHGKAAGFEKQTQNLRHPPLFVVGDDCAQVRFLLRGFDCWRRRPREVELNAPPSRASQRAGA